ncbi:hypothetical protein MRX96_009802 [Rhipicephalus microplus]
MVSASELWVVLVWLVLAWELSEATVAMEAMEAMPDGRECLKVDQPKNMFLSNSQEACLNHYKYHQSRNIHPF